MKSAWLFVVSELLLVLMIVCSFSNWKGTVGVNFGWPTSHCTLSISGRAQGAAVLIGWICLLASLVTFVAGLVIALKTPRLPATS